MGVDGCFVPSRYRPLKWASQVTDITLNQVPVFWIEIMTTFTYNLPPQTLTTPWRPMVRVDAHRLLDVLGALLGLVVFGPVILACAIWIKLHDRGPVFYQQWRVGQDGVLFRIQKLRTMRIDAERKQGACFAAAADPRVLPGCNWMRKSHVDELPQLWNVLIGDMSLVGPRPERPELHVKLAADLPRMHQRLNVRPGITGLAQIRNGYTNDLTGTRRKLAYDLIYLRHRTLMLDLSLIARTVPKVWDRGAH